MPYITEMQRKRFAWLLSLTAAEVPQNPGELNYFLTKIIIQYIDTFGARYEVYNAVEGVLSCIGQELYRRMISPHEDRKKEENGDVF
jgi:hypothetical protein